MTGRNRCPAKLSDRNQSSVKKPGGRLLHLLPGLTIRLFLFRDISVVYEIIPPSIPPPAQSRNVVTTFAPSPCRER